MTYSKLKHVIEFAHEKHKGQLDDNEEFYTHHLGQVASIIQIITNDEDIICAAWLHDVIEDCGVLAEELEELFGKRIADLVLEVTHDDHREKGSVFPRLKTRDGMMIKFADRLSNISRMQTWDDDRKEHYLRRSKFWKASLDDSIINGQKKVKVKE